MAFVGMKHLSSFIALLSVLNVMVFSVERLPVNVVYDTKTGKYYAIMENRPSTCDEYPIEYDPKTETFRDNPRYTGGCEKFKITISEDHELIDDKRYTEKETFKIGI